MKGALNRARFRVKSLHRSLCSEEKRNTALIPPLKYQKVKGELHIQWAHQAVQGRDASG